MPDFTEKNARQVRHNQAVDPLSLNEPKELHREFEQRELMLNSVNRFGFERGEFHFGSIATPPAELLPDARAELLSHFSPSAKEAFLCREKLNQIAVQLGSREAVLLADAKLTSLQLDAVLEETRTADRAGIRPFRDNEVLQSLLALRSPGFLG